MRFLLVLLAAAAVAAPACSAPRAPKVCEQCVRAHMQSLAGPKFQGRQCGTDHEKAAADYIVAALKSAGVPGAFAGGYQQPVRLSTPRFAVPPILEAGGQRWSHGDQFILLRDPRSVSAPLLRISGDGPLPAEVKGAAVFYDGERLAPAAREALFKAGAVLVLQTAQSAYVEHWSSLADQWRSSEVLDAPGNPEGPGGPRVLLKPEAAEALRKLANGAPIKLEVQMAEPELRTTHNVVGVIHGSGKDADQQAILLSAHYDHLGVQNGVLYPGADDDASGTTAVLEFARMLGKAAKPKRTVYFALFGCEEEGGLGATYYRAHPPAPLTTLAANLEFEMIGLRDPKHPDELMLTGWERSNLGPALAAHGARIGPDPYPEENFFQRSDNYQLALKGVVAQTVGGWPIPPTYHQPSDDLAHVDIGFMAEVIQSMAGPVRWLVDSDFVPQWNEGKKP